MNNVFSNGESLSQVELSKTPGRKKKKKKKNNEMLNAPE
jgi:hypothetical protein